MSSHERSASNFPVKAVIIDLRNVGFGRKDKVINVS